MEGLLTMEKEMFLLTSLQLLSHGVEANADIDDHEEKIRYLQRVNLYRQMYSERFQSQVMRGLPNVHLNFC